MVELGLYNVFLTITTPSDTRPPHAGSAAVAFEHMSYVRYTRHTSPTPPHYLATRLLLLDCCTRRFRPYTAPIQWPDGSARPPNCPPRLLCIVPASTAPPGVSRRLSVEEVPATPAMALMVMVVHLLQRGVLRRSETEFCAVRSAHASREVLDRSLSCGRSVDAIGTLQRLMSTASVLEHRAHQRRQMKRSWCAPATIQVRARRPDAGRHIFTPCKSEKDSTLEHSIHLRSIQYRVKLCRPRAAAGRDGRGALRGCALGATSGYLLAQ